VPAGADSSHAAPAGRLGSSDVPATPVGPTATLDGVVGRTPIVRLRTELLAAVAAGVLATFVSAVLVEASTDRNWSLGGWDWPETLTTSIVLTLVALWASPSSLRTSPSGREARSDG
jgi:hypothetical protein